MSQVLLWPGKPPTALPAPLLSEKAIREAVADARRHGQVAREMYRIETETQAEHRAREQQARKDAEFESDRKRLYATPEHVRRSELRELAEMAADAAAEHSLDFLLPDDETTKAAELVTAPAAPASPSLDRQALEALVDDRGQLEDILLRAHRSECSLDDAIRLYGVQLPENIQAVKDSIVAKVEDGTIYPSATPAERQDIVQGINQEAASE